MRNKLTMFFPLLLVILIGMSTPFVIKPTGEAEMNHLIVEDITIKSVSGENTISGLFQRIDEMGARLEEMATYESCDLVPTSRLARIQLTSGEVVTVYCDKELLGGSWMVIANTNITDSPVIPTDFLYENINSWHSSEGKVNPGKTWSIAPRLLKFGITEMIFGVDGTDNIWGMKMSANFEQANAFQPYSVAGETCSTIHGFISPDESPRKMYGLTFYGYDKSMITDRRDSAAGGIGFATMSNCLGFGGRNLALMRGVDAHGCYTGICNDYNPVELYYTVGSSSVYSDYDASSVSASPMKNKLNVWVAVR
eukprot:TRINITY_DN3091_c0_g1_i2.p1 TRINITY_DN3091_c0_g1~~TRINITY_DN3091_c0_g1_i2.p1  ORF type:complete len:310 (-),score=42.01 TRINITY_DN3091_c0_g1_i2:43-972(-)